VVAAFEGGSLRLLWDEVPVAAAEGTAYFGPIKMGEADASYFVVLADRTSRPLLASVAGAIPEGDAGGVDPGSWREALGPELQAAGHRWFGVQRIDVRAGSPAPKSP
jgi:hypothetical protein